jgi:hypothetical protein
MTAYEEEITEKDNCYLDVVKKQLTKYKFKELINYLSDSCDFKIEGIVRKNKVFGIKQTESVWFKYVYITQKCGCCEDDYYGTIFIPITNKHFLRFYYNC